MTYNSAYTGPQIDKAARIATVTFDDIAAMLADARTYSDHTTGDVFWTAAEGFRYEVAASGASDHNLITAGAVKLYVLPTPDGAISLASCNPTINVESYVAYDANQAAFDAAINAAVRLGIENIVLPAGTIWVKSENGNQTGSGLRLNVPENKTIRFFGQNGTVFKRIALTPPLTLNGGCAVVWMAGNAGVTYEWHNVTFDGNEVNCEYDAENSTIEEQSGNIKWNNEPGVPHAIRFFNCDVGKGRVGDGYHQNIKVDYFLAADCTTVPAPTRRTRADWQFSRYANKETRLYNIICQSIESEPRYTTAEHRLIVDNLYAHSKFDLGGDVPQASEDINPVRVMMRNVRVDYDSNDLGGLKFVYFYRVHGTFVDCHFRGAGDMRRCKVKFIGGSFTAVDAGSGVAKPIVWWPEHDQEDVASAIDNKGNYAEFYGVTFKKDAGVTTGRFITTTGTVEFADLTAGVPVPRVSLINCNVPEPIDFVAESYRCGLLEIRGGDLRGNLGIFQFRNQGARFAHLVCEASTVWDAPALLYYPSTIAPDTGSKTLLDISGEFNGETMIVWDNNGSGGSRVATGNEFMEWRVTAIAIVDSHPQGRIRTVPGLRAKLKNQVTGFPSMWQAIPTGTMNATGYNGVDWMTISPVFGTAAPTTGSWYVGDIIWNAAPTDGGWSGWRCTTAGTPGTWKRFGAIEA